MSATLWAFRDASGKIRITPTDPSPVLEPAGMSKLQASVPGGSSMRDLRRLFEAAEQMLAGDTGAEGFVEFTIGALDQAILAALMTPPPTE